MPLLGLRSDDCPSRPANDCAGSRTARRQSSHRILQARDIRPCFVGRELWMHYSVSRI
jgi:hypothetical protein